MKKETPKSPSKFGITFDKAYYMQAKEEYERHWRLSEEELFKYDIGRPKLIQHIRNLYHDRVFNKKK